MSVVFFFISAISCFKVRAKAHGVKQNALDGNSRKMKPGFALSLSYEGLSLLHRAAGGWRLVGDVALDSTDMAGDLAGLRDKALALAPGDLRCKVILPNDQIRYLTVETGSFSGEARDVMVRSALDGATPYAVDDLAYDIAEDGPRTHVAAVARETLAEAEAFAIEYDFNPVCFVGIPDDNPFLGEPFFGTADHAASLPGDSRVEPDGIAVVVIGPVESVVDVVPEPEPEPVPELEAVPEVESAADPVPEIAPEPAVTGFTSRRRSKPASPAPSLGGAQRDVPPPSVPVGPVAPVAPVGAADFPADEGDLDAANSPATLDMPPRARDIEPPVYRPALEPDPILVSESAPEPVFEADPEPEFEPDAASVTAPTLDVPDFAESDPPAAPEPSSAFGRFFSRRSTADRAQPVEIARPAPVHAPEPVRVSAPAPVAVSRPAAVTAFGAGTIDTPEDEAARMTVFGARQTAQVGGKPRYLGLTLMFGLLLFLALVAAWAAIFLDEGVAGLFESGKDEPQLMAVPGTPTILSPGTEPAPVTVPDTALATGPAPASVTPSAPAQPQAETSTFAALPPGTVPGTETVPDVPSVAQSVPPVGPQPPDAPALTDTDSAVLDALRTPDPDQIPPGSEDPTTVLVAPQGSPEDVARYAATGIWQIAPQEPDTPTIIGLNDLYVASIDRTDIGQDAVALPPAAGYATDLVPNAISTPAAAGTAFDLDARGLVVATAAGTLSPDGVMVFLGRPPVVPPVVPTRFETEPETDALQDRLAGLRPRGRPGDLGEQFERTQLGGLTRDELSGLRPKLRPRTVKQAEELDETPTAQAVAASRLPKPRPSDFAAIVRKATPDPDRGSAGTGDTGGTGRADQQVATVAPRTVSPKIPSSASVARQATLNNAINLRRVNLIGVYGTPSNRRALVRLPSGRYKKVKVGDTVDGGRVVAIGDSELRYQKSGRNLTLKIPSG
ncbi:MAG: hypothetical protein ACI8R4_000506 [Paracoccaceae bacterium]|jgi:hypothetical protein